LNFAGVVYSEGMKPIRWELGSYMYANNKWLPGAFFMVWGVALAVIFVRELVGAAWRFLTQPFRRRDKS